MWANRDRILEPRDKQLKAFLSTWDIRGPSEQETLK